MNIHLALVNGRVRMRDETSADHLSSERLAAFLDRRLTGAERERAVRHFANCAECRKELTDSRAVLDSARGPRTRRWVTAATVAAAIMAFVLIPRVATDRASDETRVRASSPRLPDGTLAIEVTSPLDRSAVPPNGLVLAWRPVAASVTYSVTVLDTSGTEVWTALSGDTAVVVPDSARLGPGRRYFWSVDARLDDGSTAKTGVRSFIVR